MTLQFSQVFMQSMKWRNNLLIRWQCGWQNSIIIRQMVGCLGQQSLDGRRPPDGFADRTLPHFPKSAETAAVSSVLIISDYIIHS